MIQEQQKVQEQAKFWLARDVGDFEVLRATYIRHCFSRHAHEGYAIGMIERGGEKFYYRGATHLAPAGSVVIINPGEIHTGYAATEAGWSYRMLYPDASLLQQVGADMMGCQRDVPFFPSPVIDDPQLAALIRHLHLMLEIPTSTLERESLLVQVFSQLVTRYADDRPRSQRVGQERLPVLRARAYLEEHYSENISLEQLAGIANLSPFHLLRVFEKETKLSPHLYLTQVRIARAKALLKFGLPIAQVALETGFVDQSHLTRHFKRHVGIPPGQYARG